MKKITCISCVILNAVKNLNTSTSAFQILHCVQDDTTKLMQLIIYTILNSYKNTKYKEKTSVFGLFLHR